MLHLSDFIISARGLHYCGKGIYHITESWSHGQFIGYTVNVEHLGEDGEFIPGESFATSTLSAAIATVEALENGEEV